MQPDWSALRGKAVLVTGASRGVGARVATLFGDARARVVVNYRNKGPRAEEVAAEVRRRGGQAITAAADHYSEADAAPAARPDRSPP